MRYDVSHTQERRATHHVCLFGLLWSQPTSADKIASLHEQGVFQLPNGVMLILCRLYLIEMYYSVSWLIGVRKAWAELSKLDSFADEVPFKYQRDEVYVRRQHHVLFGLPPGPLSAHLSFSTVTSMTNSLSWKAFCGNLSKTLHAKWTCSLSTSPSNYLRAYRRTLTNSNLVRLFISAVLQLVCVFADDVCLWTSTCDVGVMPRHDNFIQAKIQDETKEIRRVYFTKLSHNPSLSCQGPPNPC
jgi:hypothetical protein